jgi:hypothetical protein
LLHDGAVVDTEAALHVCGFRPVLGQLSASAITSGSAAIGWPPASSCESALGEPFRHAMRCASMRPWTTCAWA